MKKYFLLFIIILLLPVSVYAEEITFGEYAGQPIEWIILEENNDSMLLLSKYGLDNKIYHSIWESVTWETCELRQWLNNEFINICFTKEESQRILLTQVKADNNSQFGTDGGNDTYDKIFCLSESEAIKYFSDDASRICYPTEYAKKHGVYTIHNGGCWWWLRTPGNRSTYVMVVRGAGNLYYHGHYMIGARLNPSDGAVRPAMWISKEN